MCDRDREVSHMKKVVNKILSRSKVCMNVGV